MKFTVRTLVAAVATASVSLANAGTAPFFVPLTSSEIVEPANSIDEQNSPWTAPFGITQTNLMSMKEVEADVTQSVVRVAAGNVSSMFDMLAYDPTGRYIFIPHETPFGAGVSRYDTENDVTEVLFKGDESGALGDAGFNSDADFGAFDPVRWTPNGTLIAGEEWSGTGRMVEICNPLDAAPADPTSTALTQGDCRTDANADWRVLDNLPLSAQEGIAFSEKRGNYNRVMYFVDEDRSGSIYKHIFAGKGKYNSGQTFALRVNGYQGDVTVNWDDSASGNDALVDTRFGKATWVPITDSQGNPLPGVQDPTENILDNNGDIVDPGYAARLAADQVGATPFGRPEDATLSTLRNGNEVLYVAVTSETAVISIEETRYGPVVRKFASPETPTNVGFPETTGALNSPDNLAIDSLGNIYIIEDAPNTTTVGATGGDIWFARDTNNDGVAESLDHFLSLQVNQSEATGMIFDPIDPTKFVVAVQHPASTNLDNVPDGFGDAVWEFDLTNVQPPKCTHPRHEWITYNKKTRAWVNSCSQQYDFNFIRKLFFAEKRDGRFPTP